MRIFVALLSFAAAAWGQAPAISDAQKLGLERLRSGAYRAMADRAAAIAKLMDAENQLNALTQQIAAKVAELKAACGLKADLTNVDVDPVCKPKETK